MTWRPRSWRRGPISPRSLRDKVLLIVLITTLMLRCLAGQLSVREQSWMLECPGVTAAAIGAKPGGRP